MGAGGNEAFINGLSGFYDIDHNLYAGVGHSDWHSVHITWNENKGVFKWKNAAGVTWTLTPMMGASGNWDMTKLAVGNDCPYRNDGHEFAMIEWGSLEGSDIVTTIWGPWHEPYLRNLQGEAFEFSADHDPMAALANKPEPACETKVRKIREQRDAELEDVRFDREEEMAQIRLERDREIANIANMENENLEATRTDFAEQLQVVLASQDQCIVEGDVYEETCVSDWNRQIDEMRAHYEEQKEMVREERDMEIENTRQNMDADLARITADMDAQYEAIMASREQQLERLRAEREEECAAAGFEELCTDRFDDQIEEERRRMEAELEHMRLERDNALLDIETRRTAETEMLEAERQGRLDALREEWKVSCTDQCTVCRETQEELLEAVHLEYEEKLDLARINYDEETIETEQMWKDTIDLYRIQMQAEIDRLYAERDATCPEEAASEEMTCRERYDAQLAEVRAQRDAELEGILAEKEIQKEASRIAHEDQIIVITENKAQRLRELDSEEAVQLGMLRDSRDTCAVDADNMEATCWEEHEIQLDEIRTRRDAALEAIRVQADADELAVRNAAKEELVIIQAQLEQQLKNIREVRYDEIEKVMRQCEGGAEEACPSYTLEDACGYCEAGEANDITTSTTPKPKSTTPMPEGR